MKRERIYAVTFNSYTNVVKDTVSDGNKDIDKIRYVNLPKYVPFLVRESELLEYAKFGNGFSTVTCVGELQEKHEKLESMEMPDTIKSVDESVFYGMDRG